MIVDRVKRELGRVCSLIEARRRVVGLHSEVWLQSLASTADDEGEDALIKTMERELADVTVEANKHRRRGAGQEAGDGCDAGRRCRSEMKRTTTKAEGKREEGGNQLGLGF